MARNMRIKTHTYNTCTFEMKRMASDRDWKHTLANRLTSSKHHENCIVIQYAWKMMTDEYSYFVNDNNNNNIQWQWHTDIF